MKKILSFLLVCVLILQGSGCTGLIVSRAKTPEEVIRYQDSVQRTQEESKATVPYEVKEELVPEKVELVSEIPEGTYPKLKLGVVPVSPVEKNTVAKLQEEAKKTGQTIFVNKDRLVIETQGGNGKWYKGWVEPGTIFLTEFSEDSKTGIKEYKPVRIALCWNPVRGVKIKVYPRTLKVTERYRDTVTITQTEKVIERYRDIDYTPAIWAGVGGLVVGGVVGYLIHPHHTVRAVATAIASTSTGGKPPTVITK